MYSTSLNQKLETLLLNNFVIEVSMSLVCLHTPLNIFFMKVYELKYIRLISILEKERGEKEKMRVRER